MAKHKLYDAEGYPDFAGLSAAHVELWDWLANHPDKNKRLWPGWERHGDGYGVYDNTEVAAHCFLCEAMQSSATPCAECPLAANAIEACYEGTGLYRQWRRALDRRDYSAAKGLALRIRDIWRV